MFFNTRGNVNITITEPGVAVRVDVPREFLDGVIAKSNRQAVNDTHFIKSEISNDYYYYSIIDQSEYYPYDDNSPYSIEVQKPPEYSGTTCSAVYTNFTAPKFILLENLKAPSISGIYNFTIYIARNVNSSNGKPIYPSVPDEFFPVHVSMREDPGHIYGYVVDDRAKKYVLTKGIVYAIEIGTQQIGRGFVDPTTGFFNVTGLYPGTYRLEGSAGVYPDTGFAYAPTVSALTYTVSRGAGTLAYNLTLNRGSVLNGSITYTNQLGTAIIPLNSPYLNSLGFTVLNYTVEAYESGGKIVASRIYTSQNIQTERYSLTIRNGTRYVGYPALGTEYAGFGIGTYTIKIWVFGFTLPADQVKTVTTIGYGQQIDVGESRLPYGGVVSGNILLKNGPFGSPETPRQGEKTSYGSTNGTHFGGNIYIELYDTAGSLKGLAVWDRTYPNGTVYYADYYSGDQNKTLRFHILGFSEYYNKSYSSFRQVGSYPGPSPWDYGLAGGTYYARIWIRGYLQEQVPTFTISDGGNTTVTLELRRAGSTEVTVRSMVVRPGTRFPQQPVNWRFLCPAPRLRIYFYSSLGAEVGYAETLLNPSTPGVTNNTATVSFSGHNWSLEEIIYRGFIPNCLISGNYSVKAYTYGYIQAENISISISLTPFSPTHVRTSYPLLVGCRVYGAVTLFMGGVFVGLTENVTTRTQIALNGTIHGTDVTDAKNGSQGFSFSSYGFLGKGHFFYVDPDGFTTKDYGLDVGNYTVFIPDFGYDRRFSQTLVITANVPELGWEVGVYYTLERMIKIRGVIVDVISEPRWGAIPLVWASATINTQTSYSYDGDFYLHLPAGTYNVTFSCPGYNDAWVIASTNDQTNVGTIQLTPSGAPFP